MRDKPIPGPIETYAGRYVWRPEGFSHDYLWYRLSGRAKDAALHLTRAPNEWSEAFIWRSAAETTPALVTLDPCCATRPGRGTLLSVGFTAAQLHPVDMLVAVGAATFHWSKGPLEDERRLGYQLDPLMDTDKLLLIHEACARKAAWLVAHPGEAETDAKAVGAWVPREGEVHLSFSPF